MVGEGADIPDCSGHTYRTVSLTLNKSLDCSELWCVRAGLSGTWGATTTSRSGSELATFVLSFGGPGIQPAT